MFFTEADRQRLSSRYIYILSVSLPVTVHVMKIITFARRIGTPLFNRRKQFFEILWQIFLKDW